MVKTIALSFLLIGAFAHHTDAAESPLKPYVLSSHVKGDMVKTVIELKEALAAGGFELVGEYSPDADRYVVVVTNDFLKQLAAEELGGLFTATQSVAITRVGGKLQVAYTNPLYQQFAYRVSRRLDSVQTQLKHILGEQELFGSTGLTGTALANYRYALGMEEFDDFLHLGKFSSHAKALAAVERGLSTQRGGVRPVFRLDIPGEAISLFGISLSAGEGSDLAIISAVDNRPLRHTPRLPYTLVVRGGEVFTLHPRFKLPLDFPDLERTGRYSFTAMIKAPGAMVEALRQLIGEQ